VSYVALLRGNRNFRRFFLAQAVSSLGDWIGVFAIAIYADRLGGSLGVGAVMTARVLPGFFIGPLAGVLVDRWDRKKVMVAADLTRAGLIFSLPFVDNLLYLLVASAALECLTLLWGPAKDASLPHFVDAKHLTYANSLSLIAIYGPWPLASAVYALLSGFGAFVGDNVPILQGLTGNPQAMALWVDSVTFGFSALMIWSLSIPASRHRGGRLDINQIWRDLVEGLTFVRDHKQVRPWMLGIAGTFTAAGGVFSLGVEFADQVLGAGDRGFAFVIGAFGTGMITGLLAAGPLAKNFSKDVLFSSCILLMGAGLIALASIGSLDAAVPIAGTLGFFGGVGYAMGYALMQETADDALRGRTFSSAYTIIRIGTLIGLGVFPFIANAVGDYEIAEWPISGERITLWLAGCVVFGGGALSMRAIRHRRAQAAALKAVRPGQFIVFEGGEGAGKSTQMDALVQWLNARGEEVVTTREPGGTNIGARIRDILLDPRSTGMDPRTEALLYAADRAEHSARVIIPALKEGKIVVSDRFVDSSLAYQGIARGLGLSEIYELSSWATGGLVPDLVLFMDMDSSAGLNRVDGERDRIEQEDGDFHKKVGAGYKDLAKKYSERFVVIDAARPKADVHKNVVSAVEDRVLRHREAAAPAPEPSKPSGPIPR
jgi:dTMP kinase